MEDETGGIKTETPRRRSDRENSVQRSLDRHLLILVGQVEQVVPLDVPRVTKRSRSLVLFLSVSQLIMIYIIVCAYLLK